MQSGKQGGNECDHSHAMGEVNDAVPGRVNTMSSTEKDIYFDCLVNTDRTSPS